jgi:hypothetical protein
MAAMLVGVLSVALVVLSLSVPVLVAIGLLWLARRRLSGRRGRFDRLFSGVARGGAMYSH